MEKKYTVDLIKNDEKVGNIGTYPSKHEAQQVAQEFNIKFQRRAGKAEVREIAPKRSNPRHYWEEQAQRAKRYVKPREKPSSMGRSTSPLVLASNPSRQRLSEPLDGSFEDFFSDEDSLEEYSQESEDVPLEPEFTPEETPRTNPVISSPKPQGRYTIPEKTNDRPFMFGFGAMNATILLIDDDGYIALVEENNRYRTPKWCFVNSEVQSRDVAHERITEDVEIGTGYKNEIIDRISDGFISGKKISFYLARPLRQIHTARLNLSWVSQDEAYDLLAQNRGEYKTVLRRILDKGFNIWRKKQL